MAFLKKFIHLLLLFGQGPWSLIPVLASDHFSRACASSATVCSLWSLYRSLLSLSRPFGFDSHWPLSPLLGPLTVSWWRCKDAITIILLKICNLHSVGRLLVWVRDPSEQSQGACGKWDVTTVSVWIERINSYPILGIPTLLVLLGDSVVNFNLLKQWANCKIQNKEKTYKKKVRAEGYVVVYVKIKNGKYQDGELSLLNAIKFGL